MHYEVASGNLEGAKELLKTIEYFTNNGRLFEQKWDIEGTHSDKGLFLGRHSGSVMPYTQVHAAYIKLCEPIKEKRVFDMPSQTHERYLNHLQNRIYVPGQ